MERLRALRTERNLFQKDIAQYLGIDRTTYVKYENGTTEPSHDTLVKIAQYFNVSIDYLLGSTEQRKINTDNAPSVDDIKFALFDGEKDITDEMYNEVKRFADFVKQKNKDKKKD